MKDTRSPLAKKSASSITQHDSRHIAELANLPLTDKQQEELTEQVKVTVAYVSQLQSLTTDDVEETSQVTGMENVFREDEIDAKRMFTQEEALANARRTHEGFFVVDAVFERE